MYSESLMKRAQATLEKQAILTEVGGLGGGIGGYFGAPPHRKGEGIARGFTRGALTGIGSGVGGAGGMLAAALAARAMQGGHPDSDALAAAGALGGGAGLLGGGLLGYRGSGKLIGKPSWEAEEDADETEEPNTEQPGKQANDEGFQSTTGGADGGEVGATSMADAGGMSLSGPSPISAMGSPTGPSGPPTPGPLATSMPPVGPSPLPGGSLLSAMGGAPMTPAGGIGADGMGKISSAYQFGVSAGIAAARAAARNR